MEQKGLTQHLEFEYWGYYAAERSDAEWNHIPFSPMTMGEFLTARGFEEEEVDKFFEEEKPRLKPCPFCDNEDPELRDGPPILPCSRYGYHQVRCDICGVSGPVFLDHKHLAVQGWNKMCRRE